MTHYCGEIINCGLKIEREKLRDYLRAALQGRQFPSILDEIAICVVLKKIINFLQYIMMEFVAIPKFVLLRQQSISKVDHHFTKFHTCGKLNTNLTNSAGQKC